MYDTVTKFVAIAEGVHDCGQSKKIVAIAEGVRMFYMIVATA